MPSAIEIEKMLISSGAFSEKDPPVLGTSGIPLFYFINTEFLLGDKGEWEKYSDSSIQMISHCIEKYTNSQFKLVIEVLADLLRQSFNISEIDGISGFQRRDWPFSGTLAAHLRLPHVSFYKNGEYELLEFDQNNRVQLAPTRDLKGFRFINVSDLMTKASSALNGWLPLSQKLGMKCLGLMNVVTRKQGGEQAMAAENVNVFSLVSLDEEFLSRNANAPERAIEYYQSPEQAVKKYLRESGASAFLSYFDPSPQNSKLNRGLLFFKNYLSSTINPDQLAEFENLIQTTYKASISSLSDEKH